MAVQTGLIRSQAKFVSALRRRRTKPRNRRLRLEFLEQRWVLASSLFGVPIGQGNVLVELNPQTGAEIRRITSPVSISGGPDGLAYNGESLFLLNGGNTLFEIDPSNGTLLDSDSLAGIGSGSFDGLGFLNGKVYIQDYSANRIHVFDPVNDVLVTSLNVTGASLVGGMTAATGPDELIGTQGANTGVRINPTTGAVLGTFSLGTDNFLGVAAINNQLYFGSNTANQIRVTDRAGALVTTLNTGYKFSALASDDTRIERLTNGGFEQNLSGWTTVSLPGTASGQFVTYSSTPVANPLPAPPQGQFAAYNQHSAPGTRILYRDLVLPAGQTLTLSLVAYYNNLSSQFDTPTSLDYTVSPNQQFRIDIVTTTANLTSVNASDVLHNVMRTNVGDALTLAPTTFTADLTSFAGQTVRLRIACTNTQAPFYVGIDGVSLISGGGTVTPPPTGPRIYVVEADPVDGIGGRVEVFDENLVLLSTMDDPILDSGTLQDVEVGPGGDVFVSIDMGTNVPGKLVKFTAAGAYAGYIQLPVDQFNQPILVIGFDVAADGSFWLAHPNRGNRVFHVSSAGAFLNDYSVPGTTPLDVAVNATGQIYVSSLGASPPEAMVNVRTDGNRWQARHQTGEAVLLSPTNTVLATRSLGGSIIDAEEAASGYLYVTRANPTQNLLRFTDTGAPAGIVVTTERAQGLAISTSAPTAPPAAATARIYVSERTTPGGFGGRIEVFDQSLALVQTIDHPILDTGVVSDIEIGPSGNLFVALDTTGGASGTGGQLIEFTPAGAYVRTINLPNDADGSGVFYPLGFDVALDGTFYVAATNLSRVYQVDSNGNLLNTLNPSVSRPWDVAVTSSQTLFVAEEAQGETMVNLRADGNRWVSRTGTSEVVLKNPAGAVLQTFNAGSLPLDSEEGSDGSLYVTRYVAQDGLRKLNASGVVTATANLTEVGSGLAVVNVYPTFTVSSFTTTSTGVKIDFSSELDPATLNLYDLQGGTLGPADIVLQGATVGSIRGSAVVSSDKKRVTFVATNGTLPPDNYTLTLRSAADGFRDATQSLLDGDANGTAGGNYVRTFTVTAPAANTAIVSVPNFARGPRQPVVIPANTASALPISLTNGAGVTSATFQLRYDPTLLNIVGVSVPAALQGVASAVLTQSGTGLVTVQFSTQVPLPAAETVFVQLFSDVPEAAPYRNKQVLDLQSIQLNGGTIPAVDDDGVHIVAYFGDLSGNGTYSAQDAATAARLAVGLDAGLASFRLLDPQIIGDINGNNSFSATDTSRLLQAAVGIAVPEIMQLPSPAVSLLQGGPDPKLSLPRDLVANAGDALQIPVQIDSIVDLTGNGLQSADLVIYYDATALEIDSVRTGSLLADADWLLAYRNDPLAGRLIVSLGGMSPLAGRFAGELVEINAHVKDSARAGSVAINLASSSRDPARVTQLNEGYLTLTPAPTDASDDPIDGLLTILASPTTATELPQAQLVNSQLLVAGTAASDRILIGALSADLVRVRVGNRLLGTFATPQRIAIDGLAGQDFIVAASNLPPTLIATTPAATDRDWIFASNEARVVELPPSSNPALNAQELALAQLLADVSSGEWRGERLQPARNAGLRRW